MFELFELSEIPTPYFDNFIVLSYTLAPRPIEIAL